MQAEDPDGAGAPAEMDRHDESPDQKRPDQESPDGERPDRQSPDEEASAQQDEEPDRRPVHRLGGLGCLTMVLAVVVAIALLDTGNFFAGAAGILIAAVAAGVGLWLYTVASMGRKK